MGTRGAIGFRLGGKDYITYNHFDSYPSSLGKKVVEFCRGVLDWEAVKTLVREIRLVQEGSKPTEEDRELARALKLVRTNVGDQSEDDYYCLLREAQGKIGAYLATGFMIDSRMFMADSLFCEYAYVVNLDDEVLEFYKGFNLDRGAPGRYASKAPKTQCIPDWTKALDKHGVPTKWKRVPVEYAGVALVGTTPLSAIPEDWLQLCYPDVAREDENGPGLGRGQ